METINDIQNKFHHIAQFLGGFNKSYIPEQEDDSHTALIWDIGKSAILSQTFQKVYLELSYQDIMLRIHHKDTTYELDLLGVEYAVIEDWIKESLEDFDVDSSLYKASPGYALNTPFNGFIAVDNAEEKAILTAIEHRNIAQKCLQDISLNVSKTSSIWVWPHDFDTEVLIAKGTDSSLDKAIGLGYSIADQVHDTPYYYAYPVNKETEIDFSQLPEFTSGTWNIDKDWKGLLLPAGITDPVSVETVTNFYQEALEVLANLL